MEESQKTGCRGFTGTCRLEGESEQQQKILKKKKKKKKKRRRGKKREHFNKAARS